MMSGSAFLRRPFGVLCITSLVGAAATAQQGLKIGNNADATPRTTADELASFVLPEGFSIELVASEDTGLPKPITIAFDDAGRMWSMTATEYPRDRDPLVWTHPGQDRIVVVDRPQEPGPHQVRTFADGMVMPLGILPYRNGVFVAQGPEMLFLDDRDGDGRADRRDVLLRGFGVQDSHTLPHQLEFAPGNWIVFSQGVLNSGTVVTTTGARVNADRTIIARMRTDGSNLEVIGAGLNNIWSWAQGRDGRVFIDEANDLGYAIVPFERDTTYPSFRARLVHPDSPYHPPTTPDLNLGGTGFSGLALSDDRRGSFPDPWHHVLFVANPITRRVNTVAFTRGEDGVYRLEARPDLVATDDEFFRPVSVRFGPDGCLYIVDWYNSIISHNEVERDHPARDKSRGRVWRVRHQSQPRRAIPNVAAVPTARLLAHLQADSTWEMRAAWRQIVQRNARDLIPDLVRLIRTTTLDDVRIAAIWSIEGLGHFDQTLWRELVADRNVDVRFEAVRALSSVRPTMAQAFALLQPLASEPAFRVRYEMLRYFRDAPEPLSSDQLAWIARWRTVPPPTETVAGWNREYLAPGGPYERAFQNLLLRMVEEKGERRPPPAVSSEWAGDLRTVPPKSAEERQRISERIVRLTKVVTSAPAADLAAGEAHFKATCGACHATTQRGSGFGPSLAGSRDRAAGAILTAILDPDRAVESVFRTFHVDTNDGAVYEGFFEDETSEAIVIRLAGGARQVVPKPSITTAGYIEGSSVMPPGLIEGLTDEQVINLVRYVQSLR